MLSKIKELKEVMRNLVSYNTASERHKATLGVCDMHLRIAIQTWGEHMDSPAAKGAGDRLLEKMKGAVAGHMGNTMISLFKEVRLAMGKEAAGDVRLMAVRDDGGQVVQGEAVKGVVEDKAARVNADKEVEMDAVKEVIQWAIPEVEGTLV